MSASVPVQLALVLLHHRLPRLASPFSFYLSVWRTSRLSGTDMDAPSTSAAALREEIARLTGTSCIFARRHPRSPYHRRGCPPVVYIRRKTWLPQRALDTVCFLLGFSSECMLSTRCYQQIQDSGFKESTGDNIPSRRTSPQQRLCEPELQAPHQARQASFPPATSTSSKAS